jgi:hypothetical protein
MNCLLLPKKALKMFMFVVFLFAVLITASYSQTLGDVNMSGTVDIIDALLIAQYYVGLTPVNFDPQYADVNCSGSIDVIDALLIAQYYVGIISNFPCGTTPSPSSTPDGNDSEAAKLTGDIIFSVPSSVFSNQVTVTLNTTLSNAEIRYTTNGQVPTSSASIYSGALSFTKTTQLRAQAFIGGTASGKMGTAIYIASSVTTKHDLPLVVMDAYGGGKPGRDYQDVAFMIMELKNNETTLLQTPSVATRAGFHIRGQSSANFEKTPYRIELRRNNDDDAKYQLLGMPPDGDWVLRGPFPDKSLIRDALAYELGKGMGLQVPRYAFIELYLNLDDQPMVADDYQGVYMLVEKLEITKNRLILAKLKKTDLTEPNITGGYLLQFNMMAAEEPLVIGSGWSDLELTDPDDAQPEQLTWITNYIQNVQDAMHSSNPSDIQTGYPAYIDTDSFVNYIIQNELAREADSYVRSTFIHKDRNKKLVAGPLWDYDLGYDCFTGFGGTGTTSTIEGWQFQAMSSRTCDWFSRLMNDSSFQNKINARWKELRQGVLSDAQLTARVTALSTLLVNAAKRNFQKWPNLQTTTVGGFGTQVTQTWEEQIQILQNFLINRAAWLDTSGWKPTT